MNEGYFLPFIEAIDPRPAFPETHVSGSDTTAVDHLRQGVEITTDRFRFAGTLPVLGSGEDEHQMSVVIFGQPYEFVDAKPFQETTELNPETYIQDQSAPVFPIVLGNNTVQNSERFGAFIEPLGMGSRGFILSSSQLQSNGVAGHIQDGNENAANGSDRISGIVEINELQQFHDAFVDVVNAFGSVILHGSSSIDKSVTSLFNEASLVSRAVSKYVINQISGTDVRDIIANTTGSTTDEYVYPGYRSMGTGFTYGSCDFGVDSIAFGGLKR